MAENSWYEEITSLSPYVLRVNDKCRGNDGNLTSLTTKSSTCLVVSLHTTSSLVREGALQGRTWRIDTLNIARVRKTQNSKCDKVPNRANHLSDA